MIEKKQSVKKSDKVSLISKKYCIFFEIKQQKIEMIIESFVYRKKIFTKAFLSINKDKIFNFPFPPEYIVKLMQEVYIEYRQKGFLDSSDFLKFLTIRFGEKYSQIKGSAMKKLSKLK
jgi:hypothetical protein